MQHYKGWIMAAVAVAGAMLIFQAGSADAQQRKGFFSDPSNLQVLPADISPGELRNTMVGFTLATGLRCSNCHMGEEGQSLGEYDFASDEKELKRVARGMLGMVAVINAQVGNIRPDADHQLTRVQCITCHRGVSRPVQLVEILSTAMAEGGIEATKAKYSELREKYYGSHSYDFTPLALSRYAEEVAKSGNPDTALALLELNLQYYPDDAMIFLNMGNTYRFSDRPEQALKYYRKALELNPGFGFLPAAIERLEGRLQKSGD